MADELKPCAFCGSEPVLEDHRLMWAVRCSACTACILGLRAPEPEDDQQPQGYWARFRQTAIDAWNRRAPVKQEGGETPC